MVDAQPCADNRAPGTCKFRYRPPQGHLLTHILKVMDVAQALTNILEVPSLPGLLNLPGPSALTYEYLLALVSSVTYRPPTRAPVVPKRVALFLARAAQNVWWPALSPDEVERRYINDVEVPGDWDKVGVTPTEIEENAIVYLRRYRSAYVLSLGSPPQVPFHTDSFAGAVAGRTTFVLSSCHLLASLR